MMFKKIQSYLFTLIFIFFVMFCSLFLFLKIRVYNGDNYFMFMHAEHILSEGFTTTEPLTLHEGFFFMYPQWLFAVVIYVLKTYLGDNFVIIFMVLLYSLIFLFLYKTAGLISKGHKNTFSLALALFSVFILFYNSIRPYIVTMLLLLIETYVLERYVKSNNYKYLLWNLPVSILLINFHNSLWIGMYLVLFCYFGEWAVCRIIKKENTFDIKPLIITAVLVFFAAFVNPYGLGYISYILRSMQSLKPFKNSIEELVYADLSNRKIFFILFFFNILMIVKGMTKGKTVPLRFLFMFCGFSFMAMLYLRNFCLFLILGNFSLFYLSDMFFDMSKNDWVMKNLMVMVFVAALLVSVIVPSVDPEKAESNKGYSLLKLMDAAADDKGADVFTTFNYGSYAEYLGYRPYFDARAEVFGIYNNKKEDITGEYLGLCDVLNTEGGEEEIKDFMDKYNFTYVLAESKNVRRLTEEKDDYVMIGGKETGAVYCRKKEFK